MSGADRQRRLRERRRLHDQDDHSKCIPGRCDALPGPVGLDESGVGGDAAEGVTRDVTFTPEKSVSPRLSPAGLGERGRRLWDEMSGLKLAPTHVLLLERACRLADRLGRLDGQLDGADWLELVEVPGTDGGVVRVVVDRALAEARQHELVLKNVVAELRHAGRPATAAGATPPAASEEPEGGAEGGKFRGLAAIRGGLDDAAGG